MNITEIKADIAKHDNIIIGSMPIQQQFEDVECTKPQPWFSYWNNDARLRVSMHQEVFEAIKADKSLNKLAYKREIVPAKADRPSYVRYVLIIPRNIADVF
jgi:hypothetical protein